MRLFVLMYENGTYWRRFDFSVCNLFSRTFVWWTLIWREESMSSDLLFWLTSLPRRHEYCCNNQGRFCNLPFEPKSPLVWWTFILRGASRFCYWLSWLIILPRDINYATIMPAIMRRQTFVHNRGRLCNSLWGIMRLFWCMKVVLETIWLFSMYFVFKDFGLVSFDIKGSIKVFS